MTSAPRLKPRTLVKSERERPGFNLGADVTYFLTPMVGRWADAAANWRSVVLNFSSRAEATRERRTRRWWVPGGVCVCGR